MSSEALYEEFEAARKRIDRSVSRVKFEFYTYCMEKYSLEKGISGLQTFALFKRYGVDDFLLDHYDLLHTQGTGYVIDEIQRFIDRRKKR